MLIFLFVISDEERNLINDLLIRIKKGDEFALEQLYNIAAGRMFSVALGIMRNTESAKDVVQDSFIKITLNADKFFGGNGYAWICKIVQNTALNKRSSEKIRTHCDIDSFFNLSDDSDFSYNSDNSILIKKAMMNLNSDERLAIWLKYYNEMTVREIADELELPKSTAQDVISRAETKLKKILQNSL